MNIDQALQLTKVAVGTVFISLPAAFMVTTLAMFLFPGPESFGFAVAVGVLILGAEPVFSAIYIVCTMIFMGIEAIQY